MNQFYQQQPRPNPIEDLKRFFRDSSILPRLIIINVGIWVLVQLVFVFGWAFNRADITIEWSILEYFALPASLESLMVRPWTLISYMFLHTSFWHILFNMLWLYWFGKIFTQYLNQRQLLSTYIFGGLAGGLLYIITFNILPVFGEALPMAKALGASASVMGIVMAISLYVPNYTINLIFFGKVKIFYLALALFIIDFFMIRHGNAGGHIAHIGGAVYGFLYVYYLKKGRDLSKLMPRFNFKGARKTFQGKKKKPEFTYSKRPASDVEYNRKRAHDQKKIDHILDKISHSGYESLTKEEKAILFDSSNKK
ncbi:MAG: rhomboid family intramembrane serine protease [Bacteroidota bacterium]